MRNLIDPHWWVAVVPLALQFILFLRWLYRRVRNDEIMRVFVRDMATNHLPHIYALLEILCEQKGVTAAPRPTINWIDLNGPRH